MRFLNLQELNFPENIKNEILNIKELQMRLYFQNISSCLETHLLLLMSQKKKFKILFL